MALRVFLAGGGTAGHIEPALAVADALRELRTDATCIFLGTAGALESRLVPARGYELRTIPKVSLPRSITLKNLLFPFRLFTAIKRTMKAIDSGDVLIGFGGYVSASAYIAARIKKIPIVIHEANARPGWANRLGRHFAALVAVNFPSLCREWSGAIHTGMPIRSEIARLGTLTKDERAQLQSQVRRELGLSEDKPVVAIFGGSQGSAYINSVIANFLEAGGGADIQIIHALGLGNQLPEARSGYLPLPYFDQMAKIYAASDLVISRSGAVTCSEIMAVGKFAILVPLPHGNGEQVANAQDLVERGFAIAMPNRDFTSEWLSSNLKESLRKAALIQPASDSGAAASRIAELVLAQAVKA